ncbi:unknown [Ruminococcus sp. CAG:382]|nr:unknown [Ruminococcus sp. CAG:382]
MTFVYHHEVIRREIVKKCIRRAARGTTGEDAGIVFDTGAIAYLTYLLNVVIHALGYTLRLDEFALLLKPRGTLRLFAFDFLERTVAKLLARHIMRCGVYRSV